MLRTNTNRNDQHQFYYIHLISQFMVEAK